MKYIVIVILMIAFSIPSQAQQSIIQRKTATVKVKTKQRKVKSNKPHSKKNMNIAAPVNMKPGIYYLCITENWNLDHARSICRDMKRKGLKAKLVINPKEPEYGCFVCVFETDSYELAKYYYQYFSEGKYTIAYPFYNGLLLGPNDLR